MSRSTTFLLLLAGVALAGEALPAAKSPESKSPESKAPESKLPEPKLPGLDTPWPEAEMALWQAKVAKVIAAHQGKSGVDSTDEREKSSLLRTELAWLAGDRDIAIAAMQEEDKEAESIHAWTEGIDLYYCFTLKGQVVKYFWFGDQLKPEYRERMRKAGATWSASDPRPSLEYVLALEDRDPQVVAFAQANLDKMWRTPDEVRALADQADKEKDGAANKQRFAAYMRKFAGAMPQTKPTDVAGWRHWMAMLTDSAEINQVAGEPVHAFLVFEEYERRVNPNPHPKFGIGSGPVGTVWSPNVRGMRADARNTDNLRAMRDIAVYLFAEETVRNADAAGKPSPDHEQVRRYYKHKLQRAAATYWSMGNGEWDSMAYLGHTTAAWCNLYSFARDEEVRRSGKAVLDLICTSAARRWWNNAWGGPQARDYGDVGSSGTEPSCGAAGYFSLFFAPTVEQVEPEADQVTAILSGYRPPFAVVQLARRAQTPPREEWAAQPAYETWLPQNQRSPVSFETTSYGRGWQLGSLARGSGGDVNGFKLLIDRPGKVPATMCVSGGPGKNAAISQAPGECIAQRGNAVLWLGQAPEPKAGKDGKTAAFAWQTQFSVPKGLPRSQAGDWWIIDAGAAWVAIRPFGCTPAFDQPVTIGGKKEAIPFLEGLLLKANAPGFQGFALEIGDPATHATREAFAAALAKSTIDVAELAQGKVGCTSSAGYRMAVRWAQPQPEVWHDGVQVDWMARRDHWRAAPGSPSAVNLGFFQGELTVVAGGQRFVGKVDLKTGVYTWK
ncbi:hypothetical protein LBMAG53_13460 [Planctomycetota bacterium]|nr:hypothetical protein LBMAG53_13460 [Planctomycetota bacterium]